jgi:hypothetical protein
MNMKVTDHVRIIEGGLTGRILRIYDCGLRGNLVIVRLDQEHPLWGKLTSAWEGEVELVKKSEYEAYAAGEISDPRD